MIDKVLSNALNDSEISHEEFTNIKELTIEPSSLERMTEPITKEKLTTL